MSEKNLAQPGTADAPGPALLGAELDQRAIAHIAQQGPCRTWQVALRLREPTSKTYRRLARLAGAGKIKRSDRYSAINDVAWVAP